MCFCSEYSYFESIGSPAVPAVAAVNAAMEYNVMVQGTCISINVSC